MRKLILLTFITLDGVMQAPGGPEEDTSGGFKYGGWTVPYFDEFSSKAMGEQMAQPFSLLLGRKTFDIFASYWPQHEEIWPGINDAMKYVVSNTLKTPEWKNSICLSGDVVAQIKELKNQPARNATHNVAGGDGPNLHVYGSSNLIQTLLKNDLVDELWLKTFPITLGTGKRLFADLPADATHQALQAGGTIPLAFKLMSTKVSPSGVIFANYERAGEVKTGSF